MTERKKEKFDVIMAQEASAKYHGFGIRHVQMICMAFSMIALFVARSTISVAILAMTDTTRRNETNIEIYDWDENTQGIVLSSFFWGYMAMQLPAGLLAKKYGGKPILLIALLANGLINLLLPTLASLGGWMMVCACRIAMGLTQACLFPASHTLLGKWLPANERTTYTGMVYSGSQIGTIIAMPVSGILAETGMGWKLIFYSISGLMFITAAMWYWFSASSPGEHSMMTEEEKYYIEFELISSDTKVNLPTPWRMMFRTGAVWAIVVSHAGCSIAYILFFVELPTYLERAMKISLKNSALLSALPYVGMWFGGVISSALCEKIYNAGYLSVGTCRKIFNSIAMFGAGLGIVVLSFLGSEYKEYAIATLVAVLFLLGFTSAGFLVNHLDLSPNFAGVMLSITNFAGGLGSIITPVVTSLILRDGSDDVSRWRIVFLLVAAVCISTNTVYIIFGSSEKQPWDSPDYTPVRKNDPEELRPVSKREKMKEAGHDLEIFEYRI